jgi:hypothetical protein
MKSLKYLPYLKGLEIAQNKEFNAYLKSWIQPLLAGLPSSSITKK